MHHDPISSTLLGLVVIFLGAKIGAFFALKWKQPAVLGELIAGILIANLSLFGFPNSLRFLTSDPIYASMASLGVILLLFEVGLETSLQELTKVGKLAFLVACIGVIVPSLLGFAVSKALLPDSSFYTHLFIGSTLCATSVGITARVLKDLKKTHTKEAKIILGAAVIDDVLGLMILAVVAGLITSLGQSSTASISLSSIGWVSFKAIGFLAIALILGNKFAPFFFKTMGRMKIEGSLLISSLIFCFVLAYLSNLVGLAPIVGAFAAGLIIDSSGLSSFFEDNEKSIEDLLHPLSKFFVPIFFVHMGMQVRMEILSDPIVLILGLSLAFVGILGKLACAFGVPKNYNRLAIGIGMIPRGEVGLIFAMIGTQLILNGENAISSKMYASIIIMVLLTTVITPPALKWALERKA